jgi:Alkylmercury lyase
VTSETEEFDTRVKVAIYRITAERGRVPSHEDVARSVGAAPEAVREAFARLASQRLLLLERDGATIRMAPPFSGVPTQHRVIADGIEYFANCAWDALGIPAALHKTAEVQSRCEQSHEPLHMEVGLDGPGPSTWLFHCEVPAVEWWRDLVYT